MNRAGIATRHMTSLMLIFGALSPEVYAQATVTYVHTDALGTPVAESDAYGNLIADSFYDPYGAMLVAGSDDQPGFTGQVSDAQTGLNYMQQRYYDPTIGRFLSVDPVAARPRGDNFNRYWYANSNPYTNRDPDGRECSGKGCWVTVEERAAAVSGDWKAYYQLAGSGGDRYAVRAGEVASNSGATPLNGRLSELTNKFLADSIARNMGADPRTMTSTQAIAVEFRMEAIRVGLAKAHVQALDQAGATEKNPVMLDRSVIGEFHERVFERNGADPKVFGGYKTDALEAVINVLGSTTRDVYDYCPQPSCSN